MDSQPGRGQGPEQGSVHPADRHPLGLCSELLHGSLELTKGPLQVAVDQAEVKVVPISPLDAAALLHGPPQIRLLPRTKGFGQCLQVTRGVCNLPTSPQSPATVA